MDHVDTEKLKKERNISKIIVFGTGSYWRRIENDLKDNMIQNILTGVDYFFDNDSSKWGTRVNGIEVVNPKIIADIKDEAFILIASSFYDEIACQLRQLGLIENYHFTKDVYVFSEIVNNRYLKKHILPYKDLHKGKRAFIIGNGPSLRISDLDRLKNEITFGCNKIYLAFDQTEWRPTYFAAVDSVFIEDCAEEIKALDSKKFITVESMNLFKDLSNDLIYLKHKEPEYIGNEIKYEFSTDIADGICGGWTVTYIMLQIAFYMGITEVYLLGVDYRYSIPNPSGELSKYGEVVFRGEQEKNHFHKDYRKENDRWTLPRLEEQYKAYLCAKETFYKHGRKIYNATRETALDVFPTVNFDSYV